MTEVTKGMCCENGQTVIKIIVNNGCTCCCKYEEPEKPEPTCSPAPTCPLVTPKLIAVKAGFTRKLDITNDKFSRVI